MTDSSGSLRFPSPDEEDVVLAEQVAAMYAATPPADVGAADRCTRAILADAATDGARTGAGVLRPRWWWGAVAATLLVAVTMRPWRVISHALADGYRPAVVVSVGRDAASVAQPTGHVTVLAGGEAVRFDLALPTQAREVSIVGDFNGWDEKATPMLRGNAAASWSAQVPLTPGRHVYAFVVDGSRWLIDPLAPRVPDTGFGESNAVMVEGGTQ